MGTYTSTAALGIPEVPFSIQLWVAIFCGELTTVPLRPLSSESVQPIWPQSVGQTENQNFSLALSSLGDVWSVLFSRHSVVANSKTPQSWLPCGTHQHLGLLQRHLPGASTANTHCRPLRFGLFFHLRVDDCMMLRVVNTYPNTLVLE
ncbi:hypothetical protein CEXT_753221 [Caerostris extrusa]|uniref:Uncharacterized protein n=1 Tax=Caerostris extrusa TaxID=172846 RepID=A0AAV4N4D4_CAEEX|nr:hypothetical protein CEXT_753221 [Caerostris extrusa]